jgi:hypothetical protein
MKPSSAGSPPSCPANRIKQSAYSIACPNPSPPRLRGFTSHWVTGVRFPPEHSCYPLSCISTLSASLESGKENNSCTGVRSTVHNSSFCSICRISGLMHQIKRSRMLMKVQDPWEMTPESLGLKMGLGFNRQGLMLYKMEYSIVLK